MHLPILLVLTALSLAAGQFFGEDVQYGRKPGMCPPAPNVGICQMTCLQDSYCERAKKCCRTACGGTACFRPVTELIVDTPEKPGYCPQKPSGPWVCSSRCAVDGDCRGSKKCCKNRCGALACVKPDTDLDNDLF